MKGEQRGVFTLTAVNKSKRGLF